MIPAWQPSGLWKMNFRTALMAQFGPVELNTLVTDYFTPESLWTAVSIGPMINFEGQVAELIEYFRRRDWLLDLVAAAYERRPKSAELAAIAKDLGLTVDGPRLDNPTGRPLEQIIQENAKFMDAALVAERLPILTRQVCWFDVPGGGGTGFLIGADLVLTNDHVLDPIRQNAARWQDIQCIFDYKKSIFGSTLDKKKLPAVKLIDDPQAWLVHSAPISEFDLHPQLGDARVTELDCALLRLAEPIGNLPVGGGAGDLRGWIKVNDQTDPLTAGNQVFLLQHPGNPLQPAGMPVEPLKLTVGTVTGFNGNGTRLRYDANSRKGSSGSPCFNADMQLVALHHAYDPAFPSTYNQAVPLNLIKKAWEQDNIVIP